MAGLVHGGVADGTRLDAAVGYGLPVGRRLLGTPTVGVGTSVHGRDDRLGYRLGAAPRQQGSLLASSWRHRGRCPVAPARSEAAAHAPIVVGDVSQDVVEIPTGLTPRVQVLQPRRLITASPVIPIGFPPLVVRSVQHTVGRSASQTVITARPASAGAGNRTATSTGPPQDTNPAPPRKTPHSPIGVRAGRQVSAVRASGPHCRGHTTAKAGLDNRSIRPIRQDQTFWYERTARPAGIRPSIRNTSACPAPSRPLSPARAYAVVRRTRRRGGAVRGAAVPVGRASILGK